MSEPIVEATAPLQTVGDALNRARGYVDRIAADIVKESYPEEVQPAAPTAPAPEATPEAPPEAPTEEAGEQEPESQETDENAEIQGEPEEAAVAEEQTDEPFEVPPQIQESINKRIGKEVAKTKAAQEAHDQAQSKIQQLETELTSLRASGPEKQVVKADQPLADIVDLSALNKKRQELLTTRNQVLDLLDAVEDDPEMVEGKLKAAQFVLRDEQGQEDYSPRRMKRTLRQVSSNLRSAIEDQIPQREVFLKTESELRAQMEQRLPELKNPNSERSKIFRTLLEQFPEVKLNPRWPLLIAGQTLFIESFEKSKVATAAAAKPKPVAPKIPAKPKASAAPAKSEAAKLTELHQKMLSGDRESRVNYLAEILKD